MKSKCSVYIATSVDGYIADSKGEIDWLQRPEYDVAALEGVSFETFIAGIDALVMGRHTFEVVLSFAEWPYTLPVIVLSSQPLAIPDSLQKQVRSMQGEPQAIVETLAAEGKYHLYIDGGNTIQRFLRAGLIDELTITRIPILLGSGIPLFAEPGMEQSLTLIKAVSSMNGFVQERYRVNH